MTTTHPDCIHRGPEIIPGVLACHRHGVCTPAAQGTRHPDTCELIRSCELCPDATGNHRGSYIPSADCEVVSSHGVRADCLKDSLRGSACFLLCGGPSLKSLPLDRLRSRGFLTAAVNNAAVLFRPDLWFSVDLPRNFHPAIWRDPGVMKFTKRALSRLQHRVWSDKQGAWIDDGNAVRELQNTWFFEHSAGFDSADFLTRPAPTWGTTSHHEATGGTRSCMLPAIRILHWLGIRRLYLLGCDFEMRPEASYAFDEPKDQHACDSNNRAYAKLAGWLDSLRPEFQRAGLQVFNCNPDSGLKAFPFTPFTDAIERESISEPERVRGLYLA